MNGHHIDALRLAIDKLQSAIDSWRDVEIVDRALLDRVLEYSAAIKLLEELQDMARAEVFPT